MKDSTQLRQHVIDAIGATHLGTRNYGTVSEPSILVLPDPDLGGNGLDFPATIGGNTVTYSGIEVIIYESFEGNQFTPMFLGQSMMDSEIWILVKAHDLLANDIFNESVHLISKGLDVKKTLTPTGSNIENVDQIPLLKSQILVISYAGYR